MFTAERFRGPWIELGDRDPRLRDVRRAVRNACRAGLPDPSHGTCPGAREHRICRSMSTSTRSRSWWFARTSGRRRRASSPSPATRCRKSSIAGKSTLALHATDTRVVGLRGWIRLLAPLQRRSCGMDVCISLGTLRGPPDCVEFAVTHFPDQAEGTDLQRHENRQVTGPVNQEEDPPMLHGNPPFWEGPSPSDPPVPASPDLPRGCGDGDLPAVRIEVGQPPARTWDADCPAMGGGLCWCR